MLQNTINQLTEAILNFYPTCSSCRPIFMLCRAYHIELKTVASNREIVLTFLWLINPRNTARCYIAFKLPGSVIRTVVTYFCILNPFLCTFCRK